MQRGPRRSAHRHDFNPIATGCTVDDADVVKSAAKVTKDKAVTTGKYPEYAKVWEDGALNVVAIFGYSVTHQRHRDAPWPEPCLAVRPASS